MKKFTSIFMILVMMLIVFSACEKKEEKNNAPDLPPYESMVIDFTKFKVQESTKTTATLTEVATETSTQLNWGYAALNVGFWNLILTVTLAVPVASFYSAFLHEPVYLGNASWQWSYTVDGFASSYTARLLGTVREEDVEWKMYITKSGIGAFSELLWFEGTSDLDGMGGQWTLYLSPEHPEKYLQIDWSRTSDSIGQIKYTNIRDLNDQGSANLWKGSYIQAGYQDDYYDAYYNIHIYEAIQLHDFTDIYIEWSTTLYDGHVKSSFKFGNDLWHCWDNQGNDIICTSN